MAVAAAGPGVAFELTGGDLALDLANTKERRKTAEPLERLRAYADVVAWGRQAGVVGRREAALLQALAARRPGAARSALARARRLREAVFDVFSALAGARPIPAAAVADLNAFLPAAFGRLCLALGPTGPEWAWRSEPIHLDRVLWPAARAAAELLASGELPRLRECAARDCAWLFVDRSRNGTRRWCDMAVCGNREKARRFRRR